MLKTLIQISEQIDRLLASDLDTVIIGIDGRSGAGKTTLCRSFSEKYDCNLFHMDDFFLRPEQRSKERLSVPGENVDHERFLKEVLLPLREKQQVRYIRYNCHTQSLEEAQLFSPKKLNIVEGAYSLHPQLFDYYDFTVFLDVSANTQKERILKRNGQDMALNFLNIWIPLEEKYINSLNILEKADMIVLND